MGNYKLNTKLLMEAKKDMYWGWGGENVGSTSNDERWDGCSLILKANKEFKYEREKGYRSEFAYDWEELHHTTGKWEKEGENDDNYIIILHVEWTRDYYYDESQKVDPEPRYNPRTGKTRRK